MELGPTFELAVLCVRGYLLIGSGTRVLRICEKLFKLASFNHRLAFNLAF